MAQEKILSIVLNDATDNMKRFDYEHSFKDSLSALREINRYVLQLHEASYLEAAADSVLHSKDSIKAYLHVGPKHNWSHLQSGNVPDEYLYKSGYKQKFFSNTRFSYKELSALENKVIKYSENNGYPFASISLDSISITEAYFNGTLHYEPGPMIRFDTVAIIGDARVKRKYLESYLGISPGSLYNHQKSITLEKQLRQIQYVKVTRSPEVFFALAKAQPVLFINVRKCNQLDGYIGFQPNSSSSGKMLLTGEFNMNLKNLLQSGKELKIQWKRFDQQSQLLNTNYLHPRLFRSNIDLGLEFDLLKQDTSYLILDRKASLAYALTSASKLRLFTALRTNSVLTSSPVQSSQGYNYDFKYTQYGLGYTFTSLDDIFYPMRGWSISLSASGGNKKITNITEATAGIPLNAVQWNVEGNIQKFFRVGKKATLLSHIQGGVVQSQNLVLSDLYRIGGLKTLRGFNENNYYTSDFALYSLEYRYFTDATSYILLFYNQAYICNTLNNNYTDWPLGFGTGISFSTKAGVFQFVYSVGSAKDQPLSFNLSKISFGLVTRF
ncbi:MAG: hypothetical protein H7259_04045 [Cytophagales bacterium]|nr:hypothetical protein [Cytophaga sp.]